MPGRFGTLVDVTRIVVIAAGYRTGSTLQYNLLGTYLEHAGLGRRGGYVNPDEADRFVAALPQGDQVVVVKCHQIAEGFPTFAHPGAWGDRVRRGEAVAVSTERKPAAVERSMCRKFGIDPADLRGSELWRENEANVSAWRPLLTACQQYDALHDHPRRALRTLLRALGIPVKRRSVRHAAAASGVDAMRAHQRDVAEGTWDPVTLVHWNHIAEADGEPPPD